MYRQALMTHPEHPGALNNMGLLAFDAGDNLKALKYIQRAVNSDPGRSVFYFNLAIVYFALNHLELAKQMVEIAGSEQTREILKLVEKTGK